MNKDDGVEKWSVYFLRLALARGFDDLRKELVSGYSVQQRRALFQQIPDIELAISTIGKIVINNQYDRFALALKLLKVTWTHLKGVDAHLDRLFEHTVFYARMMHILYEVGREPEAHVTELLLDYFPLKDSDSLALSTCISAAIYGGVRSYVLETLLSRKRSLDMAERFPAKIADIGAKLRNVLSKLATRLAVGFAPCELMQPFDELPREIRVIPAVCCYYTRFGRGGTLGQDDSPSEDDLVHFVRQIRESQLSGGLPAECFLPTPRSSYDSEIASQKSSSPSSCRDRVQRLTGSDDLFASPEFNKRRSGSNNQGSFLNGNDDGESDRMDLEAMGISAVYDKDGKEVTPNCRDFECRVVLKDYNEID